MIENNVNQYLQEKQLKIENDVLYFKDDIMGPIYDITNKDDTIVIYFYDINLSAYGEVVVNPESEIVAIKYKPIDNTGNILIISELLEQLFRECEGKLIITTENKKFNAKFVCNNRYFYVEQQPNIASVLWRIISASIDGVKNNHAVEYLETVTRETLLR